MSTRAGKGQEGGLVTAGDLDYAWWQTASEHAFDARSVEGLRHPGHSVEAVSAPELERRIVSRLTEFEATFAPRQARAVALEAGVGGDPAAGLAALEKLFERGEILELADGNQTTRAHRGIERRAVAAAGRLAGESAQAIPARVLAAQVGRLQADLGAQGAQLAAQQQQAVRVACSGRQLVVIVGQAGTGKSTALTGVARAHQAAGREVIVCSTGAQAAERLVGELSEAGVAARGYSTRALEARVGWGVLRLGQDVTVIHDEAALASTREQAWLLKAAARTQTQVIMVGDPRQSQAVGAGGLWPEIERSAAQHGGLVELSRIVRARDAADRRDQARWRAGEHERALQGYAQRGRVLIADTPRQAEDRALDAAHSDRQAGKTSLVVVQTSNEQLDGLNARAQALRAQDGELGQLAVALAGRPYGLRAGDEIVMRAASVHPRLGGVANGTRGRVLEVAPDGHSAALRLGDGRQAVWERTQLDAASARLAYVAHTFPAQGQTVDRCHVIAGAHADQHGTYVALTRARERTRLYASHYQLTPVGDDGDELELARLAALLGRSQPEVPSIVAPLAAERTAQVEHAEQTDPSAHVQFERARAHTAQARAQLEHAQTELEQARAERQAAGGVVATRPRDPRVEQAYARAEHAAARARDAAARLEQLGEERAGLGRWGRLGEPGRALRGQINLQRQWQHDALADQRTSRHQADGLQAELDHAQQAWTAEHPGADARYQTAERAYERAEQRHHAAEQAYEIAHTQELMAATRPPPGAQLPPPETTQARPVRHAGLSLGSPRRSGPSPRR